MWDFIQDLLKRGVISEKDLPDFQNTNVSSINQDLGTAWGRPGYDKPNSSGTVNGDAWLNGIGEGNRPFQSDNLKRPGMPSDRALEPAQGSGVDLDLIAGLANMKGPRGGGGNSWQPGQVKPGQAMRNMMLAKQNSQAGKQRPLMAPQPRPPMRGLLNQPRPDGGLWAWEKPKRKKRQWDY